MAEGHLGETGTGDHEPNGFWEQTEQVERFEARDADLRLHELLDGYPEPEAIRVLDLGCAAGRNTLLLLRRGFDAIAVDSSRAMVDRTRQRAAALIGSVEANRRVLLAQMTDLWFSRDGEFGLVVALGIYQEAPTEELFRQALAETRRVLVQGGRCLVANFAPGTGPTENPPSRIPNSQYRFAGLKRGSVCFLTADELDEEFRRIGMSSEVPSVTVKRDAGETVRITVNALYRKTESR
jgi:SAM-dependent methyltransferase